MDKMQTYSLSYTNEAVQDITQKADYIAYRLREKAVAMRWYQSLRKFLMENLSTFPYKYPLYHVEPWHSKGYRLTMTSNDVVIYSVDESNFTVYIHAVCTKGMDIAAHLNSAN